MKGVVKRLYKPFLILFFIAFVAVNWSDVCLVSNYKFIYGTLYVFAKEKGIIGNHNETDYFAQENVLNIPKLGLKVPIVFIKNDNPKDFDKALKKGVLHYPDSTLPGQKEGTVVILGHSAPSYWPRINYDWVFTNLNELKQGDKFSIYFADEKYFYKVKEKFFLKKGDEIPNLTNSKSNVVLISCWPPGKNHKRIVVRAVLR